MNKVLVIGESCTDIFIYGKSERKSPEGNGPVFIPIREVYNAGMAGNSANNLAAMGVDVDLFSNEHIETTKTRFVNEDTNELYMRLDENDISYRADVSQLLNVDEYDAILISDYNKGFLTEEDIEHISKLHPLVILDTKKKLGDWCKGLTFIKLNRSEYKKNEQFIIENNWLLKKVILTLDGDGSSYIGEVVPTTKVDSADISGAGDTFIAGFTTKYIETKNILQSMKWANYCAGEVVKEKGVSIFKN
jgi:D-beta-D-heptose 7-phosphate kinase/D-beta-D-heptose 1-phosphate adenosyltransferase